MRSSFVILVFCTIALLSFWVLISNKPKFDTTMPVNMDEDHLFVCFYDAELNELICTPSEDLIGDSISI